MRASVEVSRALDGIAASLAQLVTLHRLTVLALIVLAGAQQVLGRL